jgi:protein involved in ribonucleotide reduction
MSYEVKNYLLLARTNTGAIEEKVNVLTDLATAKSVLDLIMRTKKSLVRGEIIDGNRNWIGDFSVKPIWTKGYGNEPQRKL